MSKEQIIDEVYENYENAYYKGHAFGYKKLNDNEFSPDLKISKEEFINKCKTDSEFSEKWGLKIEERDLTREERIDLYAKEYTPGMRNKYEPPFDDFIDAKLSVRNIPTKLITITYKDTIIESYE